MYPYIVCFCSRSLGDLWDAYKEMRKLKNEEAGGELDPLLLAITDSVEVDLSGVLDDLCLTMDCCRTRMTTLVEFKDLY